MKKKVEETDLRQPANLCLTGVVALYDGMMGMVNMGRLTDVICDIPSLFRISKTPGKLQGGKGLGQCVAIVTLPYLISAQ